MSNPAPRKPASFAVDDPAPKKPRKTTTSSKSADKKPPMVVMLEEDPFDTKSDMAVSSTQRPQQRKGGWSLAGVFFSALGVLLSLSLGLWLDQLVRDLFSRADWAGWAALAVTAIAGTALLLLVGRELMALRRLKSSVRLQKLAGEAIKSNNTVNARKVVSEVAELFAGMPETANGRAQLDTLSNEIIDGADLVGLAETEILGPLDDRARKIVLDAAKRVSIVTAVSPRAIVDIGFVIFEAGRLIRRLAELYGGRPGTIGFIRLARDVISHLAVTGSIAAGDSLVQQIIGHGLAARLSARLGEGVVNGLMTARIGIAAIETLRPLPFHRLKRPGMSDFLADLSSFWAKKEQPDSNSKN